eukprot:659578_1
MRKLRFPCIKVPNSKTKKKISMDMDASSMKQKTVDVDVLEQSGLIKQLAVDYYESAMGIKATEVPCPNISAESFFKAIEFVKHYVREPFDPLPSPLNSASLGIDELCGEWYARYLQSVNVIGVYPTAMYLDVKPLVSLLQAKIALDVMNELGDERLIIALLQYEKETVDQTITSLFNQSLKDINGIGECNDDSISNATDISMSLCGISFKFEMRI